MSSCTRLTRHHWTLFTPSCDPHNSYYIAPLPNTKELSAISMAECMDMKNTLGTRSPLHPGKDYRFTLALMKGLGMISITMGLALSIIAIIVSVLMNLSFTSPFFLIISGLAACALLLGMMCSAGAILLYMYSKDADDQNTIAILRHYIKQKYTIEIIEKKDGNLYPTYRIKYFSPDNGAEHEIEVSHPNDVKNLKNEPIYIHTPVTISPQE